MTKYSHLILSLGFLGSIGLRADWSPRDLLGLATSADKPEEDVVFTLYKKALPTYTNEGQKKRDKVKILKALKIASETELDKKFEDFISSAAPSTTGLPKKFADRLARAKTDDELVDLFLDIVAGPSSKSSASTGPEWPGEEFLERYKAKDVRTKLKARL